MIVSISSGLHREIHNVIEYLKRTSKHHNMKINIRTNSLLTATENF